MKTTATILILFALIVSCRNNPSRQGKTAAQTVYDSLYHTYTEDITSPNYVLIDYRTTNPDSVKQICVDTKKLGSLLIKNNLSHHLQFDSSNRAYLSDSLDLLRKGLRVDHYNSGLVDSLTKQLLPTIIDSIRTEMKHRRYDTFWKYAMVYDDYFIHAALLSGLTIYRDDESGFPIPYPSSTR